MASNWKLLEETYRTIYPTTCGPPRGFLTDSDSTMTDSTMPFVPSSDELSPQDDSDDSDYSEDDANDSDYSEDDANDSEDDADSENESQEKGMTHRKGTKGKFPKNKHRFTGGNVCALSRHPFSEGVYTAVISNPSLPVQTFTVAVTEQPHDKQGDFKMTVMNQDGVYIRQSTTKRACLGVAMSFNGIGASKKKMHGLCDDPRSVAVQRFHPNNKLPGSGAFCMGILIALARLQGAREITIRPRTSGTILPLLRTLCFKRGIADNIYRKQLFLG